MWQIIGQERAVSLLKHSLEMGTTAHAYLFVGPEHVGKMTLAIDLARALNCESAERPCFECDSCRKITSGNHADVQVIGLMQNEADEETKLIGIDQIKNIQHDASLPPFEGKQKVFIIDGAELMSTEAANCLLKTLEEPAEKVTFILLTTNDRRLLPTVISRCQCLELPPLSIEEETKALAEKAGIEKEKARLLAGLSRGCPGWALAATNDGSVLEQREEELNRLTGLLNADLEQRFDYAGKLAAGFNRDRGAVYDILSTWLDYWRDLMLARLGRAEMITNIDRKEEIIKKASRYRLVSIKNFMQSIEAAARQLGQNVNARLALEVLMIDIPEEEVTSPV
jgi:DNA polymerase-3 subunit delta'